MSLEYEAALCYKINFLNASLPQELSCFASRIHTGKLYTPCMRINSAVDVTGTWENDYQEKEVSKRNWKITSQNQWALHLVGDHDRVMSEETCNIWELATLRAISCNMEAGGQELSDVLWRWGWEVHARNGSPTYLTAGPSEGQKAYKKPAQPVSTDVAAVGGNASCWGHHGNQPTCTKSIAAKPTAGTRHILSAVDLWASSVIRARMGYSGSHCIAVTSWDGAWAPLSKVPLVTARSLRGQWQVEPGKATELKFIFTLLLPWQLSKTSPLSWEQNRAWRNAKGRYWVVSVN